MRVLFVISLLFISFLEAKIVVTPTVGKEISTPSKEFKDDELLMGVGIQAYINENFALDMRIASSDSNLMQDEGRTDLERGSINLLYNFVPSYKLSPYVLAGVGYEKLHRTYLNIKSQPFYHAGAGLKLDLTDNLEFVTEIRYLKKTDTKDDEIIATCGFGVKFGSDECEISCDSLAKNSLSAKINPKLNTQAKQAKPAVKAITMKLKKSDPIVFSDEVAASKYLLKHKSNFTNSSKKVKTKSLYTNKTVDANYIQVAALTQKTNLVKTLKSLKSKGFKVKTIKKKGSTVVLVGPYSKSSISNIYKKVKIYHKDAFYKKL